MHIPAIEKKMTFNVFLSSLLQGAYDESDNEDMDRAIALSLAEAEEDQNKGKAVGQCCSVYPILYFFKLSLFYHLVSYNKIQHIGKYGFGNEFDLEHINPE